ncbi:hypothetical protein J4230_01640 [Candidatus Woesearchaeota archaeon]|nr:hypothetical protein [Candidatus Woesearchaeota archaeon]
MLLKHKKFLIPLAIFLLAFILRISFLDFTLFDGDIVQQMDYADKISSGDFYLGGMVPTQGEFRTQQTFGPFHFYLLSLVRTITKNYIFAGLFMALLNSLAVLFTYIFVNRFFSNRAAVLASLLYAINPWHVILYSNYPWAPNYLPILIIPIFFSLFKVLVEKKQIWLVPMALFLGFITHPYPAGLQLYFVVFLALFLFYLKLKFSFDYRMVCISLLVFILTFVPFIINSYVIGSSPLNEGFTVLHYTKSALRDSSVLINFRDAIAMPFIFSSGYFGSYLTGDFKVFNGFFDFIYSYLPFIFSILFIVLFIYFFKYYIYDKKYKNLDFRYLTLALWFLVPIVLMIIRNKSVMPHNLIVLFPVIFIISSLGLIFVLDRIREVFRLALAVILAIFVILQLFFVISFYFSISEIGGTGATYGIPYKFKLQSVDYILSDSGTNNPNVFEASRIVDYKSLFDYRVTRPNYILVKDIFELNNTSGYLILDRVSRDFPRKLSKEENDFINSFSNNTKKFGQVEVIKF